MIPIWSDILKLRRHNKSALEQINSTINILLDTNMLSA